MNYSNISLFNTPLFNTPLPLLHPFNGRILDIIFPSKDNLSIRNIVSRSQARPTGKYPSWKMDCFLEWESPNECYAYRLLDVRPTVKKFYGQYMVIDFELNGERHWHVPDILAIEEDGKKIWEVKSEKFASTDWIRQRTAFLSWALPKEGYSYSLALSEELKRQPRLMNASAILRHGRRPICPQVRERLRRIFLDEPQITWGEIVPRDKPFLAAVCRLILEGQIGIDMDKAISPIANLWWNQDNSQHGGC